MSVASQDPSLYRHRDIVPIRRALISVSDKTGLTELATALAAAGVEVVSTGSTAVAVAAAGANVVEVSQVTGFPESLDGRVKTLHPAVHAGLLADLRLESHETELAGLGIDAFQLVVVNLYPFAATVASGADAATVVENIDIGGPAMVRASAKNHPNVAIVVDPADYPAIIGSLEAGTSLAQRTQLAAKAFRHTGDYDTAVADWFARQDAAKAAEWTITGSVTVPADDAVAGESAADGAFAPTIELSFEKVAGLRYGENPHQPAAIYRQPGATTGIAFAEQLHGKEMSYNNYVDADAALRAAYDFTLPAVAIIKHANPCGIAVGADIAEAHAKAHACDPVSAYGGVIAANAVITRAAAEQIAPIFTEVVIAPGFEPEALEILQAKKNIRLLTVVPPQRGGGELELRQVSGGLLAQSPDRIDAEGDAPANWTLAAGEPADEATLAELDFAWRAVRAVKSNGILLAAGSASVGVGMGQVNRVDSCHLAISRAGDRAAGSVAASDAFFPFADGPELLFAAGVRAIVQPGGSIRDEDVIAAAQAAGVTMYFTGARHFFH